MSVVSSWLNNEWYAPLTFRICIHGLTQYFLPRLRFLRINIHAATTVMKCNPQTAEIELSTSAILQTLIDGRSQNIVSDFSQRPVSRPIYRPVNRPVNRPIYRLVGPLLYTRRINFTTPNFASMATRIVTNDNVTDAQPRPLLGLTD